MLFQKKDRVRSDESGSRTAPKGRRTRIEDLSEVGYELSQEHLRLVSGGRMSESAGSCTSPGACDDE